jgi:hypothetical protein
MDIGLEAGGLELQQSFEIHEFLTCLVLSAVTTMPIE